MVIDLGKIQKWSLPVWAVMLLFFIPLAPMFYAILAVFCFVVFQLFIIFLDKKLR